MSLIFLITHFQYTLNKCTSNAIGIQKNVHLLIQSLSEHITELEYTKLLVSMHIIVNIEENGGNKWITRCPASPEKEDQRAAGSPAALTQLALCLRLAPDLKGRKLATGRNPQWLVNPNSGLAQSECGRLQPLLCPRHHRQVKQAVKT